MRASSLSTRSCELGFALSERELTSSADKHIFRLDDEAETPMMREDMNFELARLAEAAGIEHEVTTGMFRRLVAHKVFEQRELVV